MQIAGAFQNLMTVSIFRKKGIESLQKECMSICIKSFRYREEHRINSKKDSVIKAYKKHICRNGADPFWRAYYVLLKFFFWLFAMGHFQSSGRPIKAMPCVLSQVIYISADGILFSERVMPLRTMCYSERNKRFT